MKVIVGFILILIAYFSIEEFLSYKYTPKYMSLNKEHNPVLKKGDCLEIVFPEARNHEKRYILINSFNKATAEYEVELFSPVGNKFIKNKIKVDAIDAEKSRKVIKCP